MFGLFLIENGHIYIYIYIYIYRSLDVVHIDPRPATARLTPVRQVLIESRIVVATDDYSKELGARFGATSARRNGNNGLVATTGSGAGTNNMVNDFLGDGFPVAVPGPGGDGTPPTDRYNVNLPAAANAGRT